MVFGRVLFAILVGPVSWLLSISSVLDGAPMRAVASVLAASGPPLALWLPRLAVIGLAAMLGLFALLAPAVACPAGVKPRPALALAQPAAERVRAGQTLRILAIGSSSTTGVGASRFETTYPAQLAHGLVEALGEGSVEVTNAGVSGESAPATVKRLEAFLTMEERPDLVLWQVGTNDVIFGGTPERLGALVRRGLDAASAADVAIVVIDQQYFPLILDVRRYERFVSAVDGAAEEKKAALLQRYAMMKQWATDDPAGFKGLFAWDHFHMNDEGYACLAQELTDAIVAAVGMARAGGVGASSVAAPAPSSAWTR